MSGHHGCGETEVTDLDFSRIRIDEDVIALDITMDDLLAVQVLESLEHLMTPLLDDLELELAHASQVLPETATRNHLSYQMNLLELFVDPGADKADDVWVLELFDDVNF